MKALVFIISIAVFSCCSPTNTGVSKIAPKKASTNAEADKLPECVQKMIDQYKAEEKQNPPRQIYSYLYNGKTVYYVTPPCCDFFSELYDTNCNLIAHPDGGITGKGDGKAADFIETRSNEKLIWKDDRK